MLSMSLIMVDPYAWINLLAFGFAFGQYLHWRTASDLYSSDHCPLYITYDRTDGTADPQRDTSLDWNFKKAIWVEFYNQCNFDDIDVTDMPTSYYTMVDRLLTVARDTVPQKQDHQICLSMVE